MDFVTLRDPPANRITKTDGPKEQHFSEAAVMLAYIFHLINAHPEIDGLEIHPDGEHGKRFDIRQFLESRGYGLKEPQGSTDYGGIYEGNGRTILVSLKPGLGDVVGSLAGLKIIAECKGGVLNTRHPGQKSRLRQGLCEVVGLLMSRSTDGEKHHAVVPHTEETERLARKLRPRCKEAGIEIVLMNGEGVAL